MLLENIKRIFKKPDEEKEELKKQELQTMPLEKGDMAAMLISAFMVFIPVVLLVLGVFVLLASWFIGW